MTVVYPTKNYYPDGVGNQPAGFGYNLEEEKQNIAEATEEIKKELLEKWQKRYAGAKIFPPILNDFNPALIDFLLSFQYTLFYNEIGQKFKLNQEQRNALPAVVWNICKNKKWEAIENSLRTDLNLSPQITSQIASLINQKILFKAKELANQPFTSKHNKASSSSEIDSHVSLPLSEALRIYPEIGEQLITSNKISLRSFPYPVRPSIKNWLADYTFNLGYEKHESMARSQYLFQGANTKNLSAPEKNKLAYLLKSFDENSPITVNKRTKQVIFPARIATQSVAGGPAIALADKPASNAALISNIARVSPVSRPASKVNPPKALSDQYRPVSAPPLEQKNINSMQFSYPQKMPYEKKLTTPIPAKQEPWKISAEKKLTSPIPTKILPRNTAIKSSPWRLPEEKTFTPAVPIKKLTSDTAIKSSPWRLPDSSQNQPKNVVDLKNINQ